jgi:hypothetical protein
MPGAPGCVIERLIGAAFGVVAVGRIGARAARTGAHARTRVGIGDHQGEDGRDGKHRKQRTEKFHRSLPAAPIGAAGISGLGRDL